MTKKMRRKLDKLESLNKNGIVTIREKAIKRTIVETLAHYKNYEAKTSKVEESENKKFDSAEDKALKIVITKKKINKLKKKEVDKINLLKQLKKMKKDKTNTFSCQTINIPHGNSSAKVLNKLSLELSKNKKDPLDFIITENSKISKRTLPIAEDLDVVVKNRKKKKLKTNSIVNQLSDVMNKVKSLKKKRKLQEKKGFNMFSVEDVE